MARTKYGLNNQSPDQSSRGSPVLKTTTKKTRKEVSGSPLLPSPTNQPSNSSAVSKFMQKKQFADGLRILQLPKAPFQAMVKEIMLNIKPDSKIQAIALAALQESAEMYIVSLFEQANACALHSKRITVYPKDLALVRRLRGETDLEGRQRNPSPQQFYTPFPAFPYDKKAAAEEMSCSQANLMGSCPTPSPVFP